LDALQLHDCGLTWILSYKHPPVKKTFNEKWGQLKDKILKLKLVRELTSPKKSELVNILDEPVPPDISPPTILPLVYSHLLYL